MFNGTDDTIFRGDAGGVRDGDRNRDRVRYRNRVRARPEPCEGRQLSDRGCKPRVTGRCFF